VNSFLFFFAQSIGFLWQAVKRPFRQWTKPVDNTLVLSTILAVTRSKSELVLENALLRQQLIVLRQQIKRPKLSGLHHDDYWQAAQPVDQRGQPQAFLH
jgi:hypothetical protein